MFQLRMFFQICLLASLTLAGSARADVLTDQAKALLDKGSWQAAYDLLAAEESSRAGDVDFDLLLGSAALESGKVTNAVFALERVLAVQPNNDRARAAIARAYFALGETKTARKEFEFVREQPVSEEIKRISDQYLSAIAQLESAGKTVIKGYGELTIGYDTNVNAGPTGKQVAVPLFGGALFTLNATGVKLKDSFTSFAAGFALRTPLAPNLDLVASLAGNKRINGTYDIYDTSGADGNVGIAYKQGRDVYSLAYQLGTFYVDDRRHRDTEGFVAQVQRDFDARNQASLFLQHGWLRYPGDSLRDTDRTVLGVNAAHALPDRKTVFYGSVYAGAENEISSGVPYLGHRLWGLRIGGQNQFRGDLALFVNLGYENREYGGNDPFFLKSRSDDQTTLGAGVVWDVAPKWRVTTQYTHVRNSSNVPISAYQRDMLAVSVRNSF